MKRKAFSFERAQVNAGLLERKSLLMALSRAAKYKHRHLPLRRGEELLSSDALRPWKHRSWTFPRDPNFEKRDPFSIFTNVSGRALHRVPMITSSCADEKDQYSRPPPKTTDAAAGAQSPDVRRA
jgi:hypothetical protein